MLPRNPLPQLTPPRLKEALKRLQKMVWREVGEVGEVSCTRPSREHVGFDAAVRMERTSIPRTPWYWGRMFDQIWFKVELPRELPEGHLYLNWRDQGEATVYVDGTPWYGLDPGHQRAPIPDGCKELWVESICARTGIWVTGEAQGISELGSEYRHPRLLLRDDLAWEVYHDFLVLFEAIALNYPGNKTGDMFGDGGGFRPPLFEMSPRFRRMMGMMDDAVDSLNAGGLAAMRDKLAEVYRAFPVEKGMPTCVLTGHAHIDLVWLWPERVGEFKATHTFATMARMLDRYPEMIFGYSQPASYEAVGRRAPALMEQVRGWIKEGRWEATGAAYVESDTQLPCGEALVRSVILGRQGFLELSKKPSKVLWLPDVFGYSPCLPQILKAAGVDYFFTTKLAWSNISRFPYSSFVWRGNDGSEVTAHVLQSCGYNTGVTPEQLARSAETFQQADVHGEYLLPTGYGDGGGGVTEEMCERARRVRSLAGIPPVRWGSIEDFFARMDAVREKLPVYQGEIYLEYHRGVQTTHANLKCAFRKAERALQAWEAVHAARGKGSISVESWKRLIFAQFHDHIPGSSIQEVYDEGVPELLEIARHAGESARGVLEGDDNQACLFNPLAQERIVVVEDHDKSPALHRLPPLGGVAVEASRVDFPPVSVSNSKLDNGRVLAEFDERGRIRSLVIDGKSMELSDEGAGLFTFADFPANFQAWDIDRPDLYSGRMPQGDCRAWIEEDSGVRACIAFEQALSENSDVTAYFSLVAGESVLRVRFEIKWHDTSRLLKFAIPTAFNGSQARYGTPFGSTLRSARPGRPEDEAAFEVPASRWAAVTDDSGTEGLFVVTEAKYGFGCQSGLLHVSLLRSALITRSGENRALRESPYPHDHSDMGDHSVHLAIGRFDVNAPRCEQPSMLADTLYTLPVEYKGLPTAGDFHGIEGGDSLIPAWIKPLDDGSWVLRLHETLGRRGTARLLLSEGCAASLVDLNDDPLPNGGIVDGRIDFTPYALLGVKVYRTSAEGI